MARHKEAPYYLRSARGKAVLEFTTTEGQRKVYLGIPYDPKRSSPQERRDAEAAAETEWRELTSERVLEDHARIKTARTFNELYALYIDRWEPTHEMDVNARKKTNAALICRRCYGATILEWASDEALRSDGSKRWRGDPRTPLGRLVADGGPVDFLSWRLTKVVRKTMRKEKSNLAQFLAWAKAQGFLASTPAVELPSGGGVQALKSGRGVDIALTPVEASRIVAVMPERSSANEDSFPVRAFFEFMWLTGLRPVTICRLEVGRNWLPGAVVVRLTEDDDKAKYGRQFPLTKMAVAVLSRVAPDDGHIFGHHDRRRFVKAAAAAVFADSPHRKDLFGSYHLRHFVGTFLANRAGTNLAAASYVLGHTDLATTSIYVHADEGGARELLKKAEPEFAKAAKKAAQWAKARRN